MCPVLKKDTNKALKTVGIEDTDLYPFLGYYKNVSVDYFQYKSFFQNL